MPDLVVDVNDDVAVVTLDRPQAPNALTATLHADLRAAVAELDARADVRAIVLTGTDPAFCAGVDLVELRDGPAGDHGGPRGAPFVRCTTPLIGAVNGAAYAGGLELELCCHLLVASERATFAETHAALGFVPGWGLTVLLTDAVGPRRAREMCLTSMPVDAATAHRVGPGEPRGRPRRAAARGRRPGAHDRGRPRGRRAQRGAGGAGRGARRAGFLDRGVRLVGRAPRR